MHQAMVRLKHAAWSAVLTTGAFLASTAAPAMAPGQCLTGRLSASDAEPFNYFGTSAAISGDTVVIGNLDDDTPAGTNAGSVYVYVRSGSTWTQQAHLFASDGAANDYFGYGVAISGDTLVVGAVGDDTSGGANAGSAYVFERANGGWTQRARLFASDGAAGDQFGAVAISGDTILVGAITDDTPAGANAGSAYVFTRNGNVWTQQHLFASDAAPGDNFGNWVALEGDTAVVGAQLDDTPGGVDAGSAYVFVRGANGIWVELQHLFASDGAGGDYFGFGVEISGDTVAVTAILDDTPLGGTNAGSAYIFARDSNGIWREEARLFASDGAPADQFGSDIAIKGDTAVVGARTDDGPGGTDSGSAYVFTRSGSIWTEHKHLYAPAASAGDHFGYCVEMSDNTVVVGTWGADTIAGTDTGAAFLFELGCIPGDLNCDNAVDSADVPHFVEALLATGSFGGCEIHRADLNGDLLIDGDDASRFVAVLIAP